MINEIGALIRIRRSWVGFAIFYMFCHHQGETTLLLLTSSFLGGCIRKNYQWTKGLEGDETKWKLIATFESLSLEWLGENDHFCDIPLSRHFEDAYNQN